MTKFDKRYYKKADVVLLAMPGAPVLRPSLGLSLLKASLSKTLISTDILYANIFFEEEISEFSDLWFMSPAYTKIQEWMFSNTLFPDFTINDDAYLEEVSSYVLINKKAPLTRESIKKIVNDFRSIKKKCNAFIDSLADLIIQKKPRIVGCSSIFYQHVASLSILKKIKEKHPKIICVMGGANCYGKMGLTTVKEFPFVDYVFLGEADESFPQFVNEVFGKSNSKEWVLPPSVINREKSLKISGNCKTEPHAQISNLNTLPLPDFSDYFTTVSHYSETPIFKKHKNNTIQVEASRGCWWYEKTACTFCGLNPGDNKKYRTKSTKNVLKELAAIHGLYKPDIFMFTDNILNMNSFNEFTEYLKQEPPDYKIFFEIKSNLNRKQVKALAEAKIMHVQAGIESLNDNILRLMRKGVTAIKNIALLKYSAEFKIDVTWLMLVGFPGEKEQNYDDICSLVPLISHLQPPKSLMAINFPRFSEYFLNAEKYNLKLVPLRYYKYVYPFEEEKLSKLVYYFENINRENVIGRGIYTNLKKVYVLWKNDYFNKEGRAILNMNIVNGKILIKDTRYCAVKNEHILVGNNSMIYNSCVEYTTKDKLYKKFNAKIERTEIDSILNELISLKLTLHLNGKYLSLAIPNKNY